MSSSPESPHLDNHHRNTLRQIFEHPVSHNIEWHAVTSLFDAIGTVTVHGGKVTITVGAERQIFDHPSGKDVDAQMVVDLRHMLTAAATPPPDPTSPGFHPALDAKVQVTGVLTPTRRGQGPLHPVPARARCGYRR